jgi:hypothetical protein
MSLGGARNPPTASKLSLLWSVCSRIRSPATMGPRCIGKIVLLPATLVHCRRALVWKRQVAHRRELSKNVPGSLCSVKLCKFRWRTYAKRPATFHLSSHSLRTCMHFCTSAISFPGSADSPDRLPPQMFNNSTTPAVKAAN